MDLFGSLLIAFSMYSALPVPQVEWSSGRMKAALCFFPMVGAVQGALLIAIVRVLARAGAGTAASAAALTVWPVLFTGGIHMDGYLDVTDARRSFGSREKKLEILKDPHVGAFAVIGACVYFLIYFACAAELAADGLTGAAPFVAAGGYVLERALSGLSLVVFPGAKKDGLGASFARASDRRLVITSMIAWGVLAAAWMIWHGRITGIAAAAAILAAFARYRAVALGEFGGMTGDLAGWFLSTAELWMMIALAAAALLTGGGAA